MPRPKGKLFVISGPSGAGKSTIVGKLLELAPDLVLSISYTSRSPRKGEIHGKNYFFISREEFLKKIKENFFLEWAEVHGNLYGTPAEFVLENLEQGHHVILEIDVQGALKIKEKFPEAVLIFIEPPDFKELEERLKKRSTESEEALRIRLENARHEIELAKYYNYRVVNNDIKETATQILRIIREEAAK